MKSVYIISNTIIHFARQLFTPQFEYSLYGGFLGQCIFSNLSKARSDHVTETHLPHFFFPSLPQTKKPCKVVSRIYTSTNKSSDR